MDNSGSWTTLLHPSFTPTLPPSQLKLCVATYLSRTATYVSLMPRSDLTNDPDAQCLTLSVNSGPQTLILNIYNEKSQSPDNSERTINRCVVNIPLPDQTIAAGNFNAHYQWCNSNIRTPKCAEGIIAWVETHQLQLLNDEDIATYHYQNGTGTSILDLTFIKPISTESITSWAVDDEATSGSDHEIIRFEFSTLTIEDTATNPICPQFNFKKADWTQFHNTFRNLSPNALLQMQQHLLPLSDTGLEQASTILRDTLLLAAIQSIPVLRPSPRSKPWWNDDLTTQRQQIHLRKRRWKTTRSDEEWMAFQAFKNTYFHAIRQAKQEDRRTLLVTAKEKVVFTAYIYTKPRWVERTPILNFQGQ